MSRRRTLTALTLFSLFVLAGGCGGASRRGTSHAAVRATDTTEQPIGIPGIPDSLPFLGDSDIDRPGDNDGDNAADDDGDRSQDYKYPSPKRYLDEDDRRVLDFGNPATEREERALKSLVKRYYAAAAAGDGAKACSMLDPRLAAVLPGEYGNSAGARYLRGAKTCEAVMSRLFKHVRGELAGAIEVTSVRTVGNPRQDRARAQVLLGSNTLRIKNVMLERFHGTWRIEEMFGSEMP